MAKAWPNNHNFGNKLGYTESWPVIRELATVAPVAGILVDIVKCPYCSIIKYSHRKLARAVGQVIV